MDIGELATEVKRKNVRTAVKDRKDRTVLRVTFSFIILKLIGETNFDMGGYESFKKI